MSLLSFIGSIFKPAVKLVDELHVSDEERGKIQVELSKIQAGVNEKFLELDKSRIEALAKVQSAEAGSNHWLTATWRPLCSIAFVIIIVVASFGLIPQPSEKFYELAQIFLGAYTLSRGAEKAVGNLLKFKSR